MFLFNNYCSSYQSCTTAALEMRVVFFKRYNHIPKLL